MRSRRKRRAREELLDDGQGGGCGGCVVADPGADQGVSVPPVDERRPVREHRVDVREDGDP